MTLSELIAKVGDANIKVQPLDGNCILNLKHGAHGSTITFVTDKAHVDDRMNIALAGGVPKHIALILWIPREFIGK